MKAGNSLDIVGFSPQIFVSLLQPLNAQDCLCYVITDGPAYILCSPPAGSIQTLANLQQKLSEEKYRQYAHKRIGKSSGMTRWFRDNGDLLDPTFFDGGSYI